MTRIAVILAALAPLPAASGCGGGGGALSETAGNLGEIESGVLAMELVIESRGREEARAGFELHGPFALPQAGELPVAEVRYTKIASGESADATFISTGERAFVETGGTTYELADSMVADMRAAEGGSEGIAGLEEVDVGDWIVEPETSAGEAVGGDETERIRGRLDVVAAVNDLLGIARGIGAADLGPLEGRSAKQLERSVQASSIEVLTGAEDPLHAGGRRAVRRLSGPSAGTSRPRPASQVA